MEMSPLFFYLFGGLAIASSLMVVFKKNPISSAFSLVLMFFAFAGIYALLQAHLLAALQIIVYAGAIMVLFIFVIMLLNVDGPSLDRKRSGWELQALVFASILILLGFVVRAFRGFSLLEEPGRFSPEEIDALGGNTAVLSQVLFSEYVLPFELTSVLLLTAIVAVVAIAMRQKKSRHKYRRTGRMNFVSRKVDQ